MLKCTGLYWFAVVAHRSAKKNQSSFFANDRKKGESTCTLQPKCHVGGPLLHVNHIRTMSSLANVESEDVCSSSTPYSARTVHRFRVCDPYFSNFDKVSDWGHILLTRATINRQNCSCTIIKQRNLFKSQSVHPPW